MHAQGLLWLLFLTLTEERVILIESMRSGKESPKSAGALLELSEWPTFWGSINC